eukprot:1150335-Pelagomonas_calceolata.AAC.2
MHGNCPEVGQLEEHVCVRQLPHAFHPNGVDLQTCCTQTLAQPQGQSQAHAHLAGGGVRIE